jgi:putative membrane protein
LKDNKRSKATIIFAIIYGITLIISAINGILANQWDVLGISLLALVCIPIPFIITHIARTKKIVLPPNFELVTLLFSFSAQYLGEIVNLYNFWWWDLMLHGIFGFLAVITGLYLVKGIITKEANTSKERFIIFKIIFAFSFAITLGTLWEMFEFLCDYFFKTEMVTGGLEDTATDLLVKICFALTTCLVYYFHEKNILNKLLK